jgi:hypothetical protein
VETQPDAEIPRFNSLDPKSPGFREEAARQARLLNASPDEAEIMDWIEAATAEIFAELDELESRK